MLENWSKMFAKGPSNVGSTRDFFLLPTVNKDKISMLGHELPSATCSRARIQTK